MFLLNLPIAILRYLGQGLQGLGSLAWIAFAAVRGLDGKGGIGSVLGSPEGQRHAFAALRAFQPNLVLNRVLVKSYANTGTVIVTRRQDVRDVLERDDLFAELETLKAEGKIRGYGAALGPALKPDRQIEEGLYSVAHRRAAVHIIFNMLEQMLGEAIGPIAQTHNVRVLVRVPHASGLLEGGYSEQTTFDANDHRSHRLSTDAMRKQWLLDGIKKIEKLRFAADDAGRTLGQMAIQWLLAQPGITSLFPNIYDEKQIDEFATATDTQPFSQDELARVADLYAHNFYLDMETAA